jgi:3-oxoacyl-[acyl-carrier protein] reductase
VTPVLAVVTGASRGIGRETAVALCERGARVFLLGRAPAALQETARACRLANPKAAHEVVSCDLADATSIDAAAARVLELGAPRVLVNCAGIVERAPLGELQLASLELQLDTNLVGPIWLTRKLLPGLLASGHGRIVNVASISAQLGTARQVAYNASKWGLLGFTKSLAEELSGTGSSVVAVLPGSVDTEMGRAGDFPPRMSARDVALTLVHYALDAPLAHNGGVIEMFGV